MKRFLLTLLLLITFCGNAYSEIQYIPLATPKHIPELTGSWVIDQKQSKKLMRKAESEIRTKIAASQSKPRDKSNAGDGQQGSGPGGGGPGGGGPGGSGRGTSENDERSAPKADEMIRMIRADIDFALPVNGPLHLTLDEMNMNFGATHSEEMSIPLSGKSKEMQNGLRVFGSFTSSGYSIEFNSDDEIRVAYTYWIEKKDVLRVRTEISNHRMPIPFSFDRIYKRNTQALSLN